MKYYAGIGSRETPKEYLLLMEKVAEYLAKKDYVLRSGHADGADMAFENGCDRFGGKKEIYLPWQGFNGSNSKFIVSDKRAFELAEQFHLYWYNLKDGARKLQARNSHQILGNDLQTKSDFILCWTKNGKGSGGTGQAIRIAKHYEISVFDMGCYKDIIECKSNLKEFLKLAV